MESFFSTLNPERLSRKLYRTRDELRADVFDYIERFYAPQEVPLGTTPDADIPPLAISAQYNLKIYNVLNECVRSIGGSPYSYRAGSSAAPFVTRTLF
jgi:hypothetical protein